MTLGSCRGATLLMALAAAGCGSTARVDRPAPARAALSSCGVAADCPPVGSCESVSCSGNACVAGDLVCDCVAAGGNAACDDGNPCTSDICVPGVGGVGACSHASSGTPGVNGCCGVASDCPAAGSCQVASCVNGSCTYTAAAAAGCCNGPSNCGGGAGCVANRCTCVMGQKYCDASATCVAATGCCAASECPAGNACQAPTCTAASCGFTSRGTSGCCNPSTVATDCGSGGVCTDNTCSCTSGFRLCNGRCIAQGACCSATDCDSTFSTGASCAGGVCTYTGCVSGRADCDKSGADTNGCETDIASSTANCGGCGQACVPVNASAASCAGGVCGYRCTGDFGDCIKTGANTDGCETNLDTSTASCGACGRGCSAVGAATLSCSGGVCTSACVSGRANCSLPAAPAPDDGCETATASDVKNCGGCGLACPGPENGCQTARCLGASCGYVSTGQAGCCNGAGDCSPNVCQNAACIANQCVYTAKPMSGCCSTPANCPAQPNPCVIDTCSANRCGTMVVACPDAGVDLGPGDLAVDMTAPEDLAPSDLGVADLAPDDAGLREDMPPPPEDLAAPDLSAASPPPLSLTGGGGCAVAAPGAGAAGILLALLAIALLFFRRAS